MKTAISQNDKKQPAIIVDPTLDKYADLNLFPEKLARANKLLKGAKLPGKQAGK